MASPTSIIAGIWSTAYNSIANANSLLKHLDETDVPFHGDNKAIIKGEALALRAMLHFDLLRCFGVSYQVDPSKPSTCRLWCLVRWLSFDEPRSNRRDSFSLLETSVKRCWYAAKRNSLLQCTWNFHKNQ